MPRESLMMRRPPTPLALVASLALAPMAAKADAFKCPSMGGDFVFGQEANINTLDQMTSATISTRNIAMNVFESLMTRDENMAPMPELAAGDPNTTAPVTTGPAPGGTTGEGGSTSSTSSTVPNFASDTGVSATEASSGSAQQMVTAIPSLVPATRGLPIATDAIFPPALSYM